MSSPGGAVSAFAEGPVAHVVCPACGAGLQVRDGSASCVACAGVYRLEGGILRLSRRRGHSPGYDPHYFDTLFDVEDTHFWYVSRRRAIREALLRFVPDLADRPLFDVGCGSGGMLKYLAESGLPVAGGCDAYVEGLRLARRRVTVPLIEVDDGTRPPLAPGQRLLGMFDVLEHMDDDEGVLGWLNGVLAPGGALILTVPAHPFLFDEMDVLAFHRRRYAARELRQKLERTGFEVRWLSHLMGALVPPLVALRWFGRRLPGRAREAGTRRGLELRIVPVLNGMVRAVLEAERRLSRVAGGLPFGTSLLAVAARPQ